MKKFLVLLSLFSWPLLLLAQLTIKVTSIPGNTPAGTSIYVAGTFNGWNPENPDYILDENQDGTYQITIETAPGEVKFKFTRGGWATVEGNANGNFQPDHVVNYPGGEQTVELPILSWEDLGGSNSTATDEVQIIATDFYMPQLNRNRRIWIYLPPDYENSEKYYPVLYMHDGQNVFDASTSFSGEWEVDESLNALFADGDEGIIVVGIDNGGASRTDEYVPWVHPQYGGGEGDAYINFIVETLKPHIDENFRTRPEREYTGLMGSSLGGLISLYGAIEHQDVFSKAGIFSPAFWIAPQAYEHVSSTGKEQDMRIYFLAGEQESASMVSNMQQMYNTLLTAGFANTELFFLTHGDGQHSEWYWAREFPDAYIWLYANVGTTATTAQLQNTRLGISPNPADSTIELNYTMDIKNPFLEILALDGKVVMERQRLRNTSLDVSRLAPGTYLLNLYDRRDLRAAKPFIILR